MSFRVQTNKKALHKPCKSREDNTSCINKLKTYMLMNRDKAVGIAANQLFMTNRVFAMWYETHMLIFVNPVIDKIKGVQDTVEGCLSIKNGKKFYKKIRPTEIVISSDNHNTMTFKEFYASVITHEMDHLNGVLISDENLLSPAMKEVKDE